MGLDKLSDEDLADIEKQAADTYDGYVSTYASYFTQAGASEEDAKKQAEDYLSTMAIRWRSSRSSSPCPRSSPACRRASPTPSPSRTTM
jgi:hypothetical protein